MVFDVIYVDPAWTYADRALAGQRGAGCKYTLMADGDMQALPVPAIAAEDCALFMWATMPKLQEALDLGRAWDFEYKTVAFTWVKTTLDGQKYRLGMGRWTRANAELVLLFTRGRPTRQSAGVSQVIAAPPGRHSAKPPETRDRIVRLLGDVPRIELFARDVAAGWVALGGDIDGRDLRASIPEWASL